MLCRCPKLTPLQTRLLASLSALALLSVVYWSLSNPRFAYASELALDGTGHSRTGEDHNWHRIRVLALDDGDEELAIDEEEPGSGLLEGRSAEQTQIQGNNIATPQDISPGDVTVWEYPNRFLQQDLAGNGSGLPIPGGNLSIWDGDVVLQKRHDHEDVFIHPRQESSSAKTIYVSANTCQQPSWSGSGTQSAGPPQLTLWLSTTENNANVGPMGNSQQNYTFIDGYVNASVPASGDWYMAVSAPSLSSNFTGSWKYEIAVSLDKYFHGASTTRRLFLVDTDLSTALLVTDNFTFANATDPIHQEWMALSPPLIMFVGNANVTEMLGLESSFCGLQNVMSKNQQLTASQNDLEGTTSHISLAMTNGSLGNKPKEQFYVTDLNSSSTYQAYLAMQGNSTSSGDGVVGGGGKVWGPVEFMTKTDGNCRLLFNLTLCSETAYAVPSNPNTFPALEDLQNFYNNYTEFWYTNFANSLAQIPCSTTSDAQYSLARTCDDCAAAYKAWLCAVSIPRCEDFSKEESYLQVRNVGQPFFHNDSMLHSDFLSQNYIPMSDAPTVQGSNAFNQTYISSFATNQSRNPQIDLVIQPGPYKEVLPCEDLCFNLVQSCPAALGFACPYSGRGLEAGYGKRSFSGGVQCNYHGAVYDVKSVAWGVDLPLVRVMAFASLAGVLLARA